ncbi:MAG: hypothetical protein AB1641_07495 [Thermodesulfobacteriota bacterium]
MSARQDKKGPPQIVKDQGQITATVLEIIEKVKKKRGRPLQPRDRMALKLLTPQNSALIVRGAEKNLGCRQICFDLLTDDLGLGCHCLKPSGLHVFNPDRGWWSDDYGPGQFLWNLYLKENAKDGLARILKRLFGFKLDGFFGPKADLAVKDNFRTIAGLVDQGLKLYIEREEGMVETTLRRLRKANGLHSPADLGLKFKDPSYGRLVLLFGQGNRFGISFQIEKI